MTGGYLKDKMRHGRFSDREQCHLLNLTCDMGIPLEGPRQDGETEGEGSLGEQEISL